MLVKLNFTDAKFNFIVIEFLSLNIDIIYYKSYHDDLISLIMNI